MAWNGRGWLSGARQRMGWQLTVLNSIGPAYKETPHNLCTKCEDCQAVSAESGNVHLH